MRRGHHEYRLSDRGVGHAGRIHLTTGRCKPGNYPGLYHQCLAALDWLEFLQTSASPLTYLGRDQRYNNAQTHLDGKRRHTTDYCFSQYRIHFPSAYTLFAHQISNPTTYQAVTGVTGAFLIRGAYVPSDLASTEHYKPIFYCYHFR